MDRSKKESIISSLKKDFKESNLLVVSHYSGLNVRELEDLRAKMREVNAKFKITKNRLTKLALPGTSFENVSELFSGPTAIAYSEDPLQAAKVAVNYSKDNKKLIILGGSYEGKLIDDNQVRFLASLPTLDEIRQKIVGILEAPGSKIALLLQESANKLVGTLNAYAKKTN